jgi:hypothetical protein
VAAIFLILAMYISIINIYGYLRVLTNFSQVVYNRKKSVNPLTCKLTNCAVFPGLRR